MRSILRKLDKRQILSELEYKQLLHYIDNLFDSSLESYDLFYARYASILWQDYSVYIPHFKYDIDDLINHLFYHPELFDTIDKTPDLFKLFPAELHSYVAHNLNRENSQDLLTRLIQSLPGSPLTPRELPAARSGEVVFKYEDGNPYKEIGLKSHFERLAKYQFITRLQSYRYLTRSKASQEKIDVLADDKLGGIYTNKEKSIYYYIFLNERDIIKAKNACSVLNIALYGKSD
ncbi:hypothetical protein ASZ90_019598 [hydrocarbon metagenome]|uniref:Uncharacterized protein n=1 Tax=hydrocarbon metagenome TaxID=938273 RepID=A0A0W8E314_9ZZZZ